MMRLRFQAGGDSWVKGLCSDLSVRIRILGLKYVGAEQEIAHFVDISKAGENLADARKWLDSSRSTMRNELTALSGQHMVGVVVAKECKTCASLIGSDSAMFFASAATEDDCSMSYKVFLSNEGVPQLLKRLARDGVGYKISEIAPISPDFHITTRQLNILKSAMEMGLYDFPRRVSQNELAEKLGIQPSTLSETLRRAEKNILGRFLSESAEIGE